MGNKLTKFDKEKLNKYYYENGVLYKILEKELRYVDDAPFYKTARTICFNGDFYSTATFYKKFKKYIKSGE